MAEFYQFSWHSKVFCSIKDTLILIGIHRGFPVFRIPSSCYIQPYRFMKISTYSDCFDWKHQCLKTNHQFSIFLVLWECGILKIILSHELDSSFWDLFPSFLEEILKLDYYVLLFSFFSNCFSQMLCILAIQSFKYNTVLESLTINDNWLVS